jgi:hypothetical protein
MKDRECCTEIAVISNGATEVAKLRLLKIPVNAFTSETSAQEREEVSSRQTLVLLT